MAASLVPALLVPSPAPPKQDQQKSFNKKRKSRVNILHNELQTDPVTVTARGKSHSSGKTTNTEIMHLGKGPHGLKTIGTPVHRDNGVC